MGNNLIHNYLNNMNTASSPEQKKKNGRSYFGMPSVSSPRNNYDSSSNRLIKPLEGRGHLVDGSIYNMPKEFVRDTVYTTKALTDGVRGKANDHQLGKLNDLGLKLSGVAIATYLMTRKATPKTKAMEFIGFGSFLASMALWPKIALEIPARIIHGFNFRKQYIDDQGRKKYVTQDPNYIPFDLYKGDKKSEDLEHIADRAGIRRDIQNRKEAAKDHIRKVSVQNNTLWMLTAGIATPIMTALTCNFAEKWLTPFFEKYSNKKANTNIDAIDGYLNNRVQGDDRKAFEINRLGMHKKGKAKPESVEGLVAAGRGKNVTQEQLYRIADALSEGMDSEMKDATRADVSRLVGGEKYVVNSKAAEGLAQTLHETIKAADSNLATVLTPERIQRAASEGMLRGAVQDMIHRVGGEFVAKGDGNYFNQKVVDNFLGKEVDGIDFFAETAETAHMTPEQRLARNIEAAILKVNNDNPGEDFISGMSNLERENKGFKLRIDEKLKAEAEQIAHSFYEGTLSVGENGENYVRTSINDLYRANAPKDSAHKALFGTLKTQISEHTAQHKGYVLGEGAADSLLKVSTAMQRYKAVDTILADAAHFKVEKANETLVANNWSEVTDVLVKKLGISDKELKLASKSEEYSKQLFAQKLEEIAADENKYKDFMTSLSQKMAELDAKMDAPNEGGSGRMMDKVRDGFKKNSETAGEELGNLGMTEMRRRIQGSLKSELEGNVGSIGNSRVLRLASRVEGVHSSYMRILQTAEFFHRAHGYESEMANRAGRTEAEIAKKYGFAADQSEAVNREVIKKGKELLLDAHTDSFYTKAGLHTHKNFFKTLMWAVYKPSEGANEAWLNGWNKSTQATADLLDGVRIGKNKEIPRRVFEGEERKTIGVKLKEHMNLVYNSMGSIKRNIIEGKDVIVADGTATISDQRAMKRFDLLGKAPSDLLHDTLKQKYNSKKWMKTFAPILGITFGATILAQFFFGKVDSDLKE